ncbi:TIGR03915 family putative DNA repair protein [Aquimarina mytili]|uniref:TIGR03915 family putative DNA repair protein n=1 Tax=Aquimarina mytili TaxID=874423 RepID=A0A937DB88_9FLAO|nr:TIGR03915 family putative DNA repair protein [Aquimarina mytili]MBL0683561.1 TIGR03915 family putative DNA repair protein [Aquimarina mytili]
MNPQTILLYDGSFDGFLCCIFEVYSKKITAPIIRKEDQTHNQLFTITEQVQTLENNAQRVWKAFKKKTTKTEQNNFFKAFLSEIKGVENTLLNYTQYIFKKANDKQHIDFSNKDILKINQVARMVEREKHRMEAFVRFQLTQDGIYTSSAAPDFNVLPLIIHHFKDRYADQKWLIYDMRRKYGIYYNLKIVDVITFENVFEINNQTIKRKSLDEEIDFQKLWTAYYKNVNIKSRKNSKLHHQHIPKRYWKYLTEKNNI